VIISSPGAHARGDGAAFGVRQVADVSAVKGLERFAVFTHSARRAFDLVWCGRMRA